ncbi:1-(5-phosphoribosyl)-5-[(5-phosphoribosylamino)methylideneamino]imidazole-4-carboxamide isomerase [Desulfuribacillus stibiiarsenatis]|uniref:1-(5-phosphoribosyl)-5-[(5-phosphoribosylamino)methylideneamino] imidazole-4-carboxamide isomerase n=1 Tax=Desulfuribacillus stibiiarsenatis TaxID=1390249 RepID=A0A1E5L9Z6_9FIRM|nr:1-(5-phosphoribosyl)-5-[(5-phosphoribosylamino)methylideneamino]imidazole-4-carboxamide isomerase [Desulfuribacillus stibiiarsenatis]OEH86813.1 1-(5-phosphoribosyl)-5-[(5-phosphoribosylamino)methylideneamino]imidazole-4-carboxamide isomerase [Desulfuribacillus stibiiarsenatis]
MNFTVYPAIDMRGGKCVRLFKGDFAQETVYHEDPVSVYKQWVEQGAKFVHVVDLDGAKDGKPAHLEVATAMVQAGQQDGHQTPVQYGGGIRSMETLAQILDAGIDRAIIGTSAVEDKQFVKQALETYGGERVVIGLDCRNGYVATKGWLETAEVKAVDVARELKEWGAKIFVYTDISRDGTLTGPNIEEMLHFAEEAEVEVIASGGVSNLQDIKDLADQKAQGIVGAIVGKALYTNAVTLQQVKEEGIEC